LAPDMPEGQSKALKQLCPAMRPSRRFYAAQLVFAAVKVSYILTTCPYFDNLSFYIFDGGGTQCHFITSVPIAIRIRTLSVY